MADERKMVCDPGHASADGKFIIVSAECGNVWFRYAIPIETVADKAKLDAAEAAINERAVALAEVIEKVINGETVEVGKP